jgi:hypothetical protein
MSEKTPASTTTTETTSNDGKTTGIPVAFTPVPTGLCVERTFILEGDADYLREQADAKDAEAATYREAAEGWRRISEQSAEDAERAKKAKFPNIEQYQGNKAAEHEQRAQDYEARADKKTAEAKTLRAKADAEDRERAELEKKRCKSLEDRPRNAFSPEPVKVSTRPENPNSSKPPAQPKLMCGPDITDNVFRVLDKIHSDWNSWNEGKRNELCRDLINPATYGSAWDIKALAPDKAPPSKKVYLQTFSTLKNYQKYIAQNKWWFEAAAAACAKPRWPCGHTVTFLGKCIHAQVVNYVQWGVMNKLCDQEGLAKTAHRGRAAWNSSDAHLYDGQKIMTGVGSAYTTATQSGKIFEGPVQSSDPGEMHGRHDNIQKKMKETLSEFMAAPGNSGFASRPAIKCSMPCQMTTAESAKLNKSDFGYGWGYGSRLGVGGR